MTMFFRNIKKLINLIEYASLYMYFFFKMEKNIFLKILMLFVVLYILSPIDLIPDFIPVIGILDELIIIFFPYLVIRKFKKKNNKKLQIEIKNFLINKKKLKKKLRYSFLFFSFLTLIVFLFYKFSRSKIYNYGKERQKSDQEAGVCELTSDSHQSHKDFKSISWRACAYVSRGSRLYCDVFQMVVAGYEKKNSATYKECTENMVVRTFNDRFPTSSLCGKEHY